MAGLGMVRTHREIEKARGAPIAGPACCARLAKEKGWEFVPSLLFRSFSPSPLGEGRGGEG